MPVAENNVSSSIEAVLKEEIQSLHRQLAHERLRADQGWQRYQAANADRTFARAQLAAVAEQIAKTGTADLPTAALMAQSSSEKTEEFNRAISFAIGLGLEADTFLRLWQHGEFDVLEREFNYPVPKLEATTALLLAAA